MKTQLKHVLRRFFPNTYYWLYYRQSLRKIEITQSNVQALFSEMLANSTGKNCLQIGVKEGAGAKFGEQWVSVDKYDTRPFIDRHDDIHDLQFEDATFDIAVCISILEHVDNPAQAVSELKRVLKPGGLLWIQSPMAYPYHPDPLDLWRFTPTGLIRMCGNFDLIQAGAFRFTASPLVASAFFYGRKC